MGAAHYPTAPPLSQGKRTPAGPFMASSSAVGEGLSGRGRSQVAEGEAEPLALAVEAITERFPVVVANIEARVLIPMAPALAARVQTDGLLVLSGILEGQQDDVSAAYAALGPARLDRQGEWLSLTFGDL
ncbi:MAG: hypothetical protein EOO75_11795 [Myxococcales bacterium]|nr:MAG: hypothetical protein EOO75_11795 [Myxococcales bacterium]